MRQFSSDILFSLPNGDRSKYIPPCGSLSVDFEVPAQKEPTTYRLRLKGEPDYFWRWRSETGAPFSLVPSIDDAMSTKDTFQEKFALELVSKESDYWPRNFYAKVPQGNFVPGLEYVFSIPVKGENFQVQAEGNASAVLEIFLAKEGRHPDDVYDEPESKIVLAFPSGSYPWTELKTTFRMPENAVCLLFHAGIVHCSGKLLLGSPQLTCPELAEHKGEFNDAKAGAVILSNATPGEETILPPFARTQTTEPLYNYFGENLSRRDWLECRIEIDGKVIFDGEKYTSIVRRPDFSFEAGVLSPGKHTMTIILQNDYENAVGFLLAEVELQAYGNHEFELIGAPETIAAGLPFSALLRINRPNLTVSSSLGRSEFYAETGLHAFHFDPLEDESVAIELTSENWHDDFSIKRVAKGDQEIYLDTGDAIYVQQDIQDMDWFIEWVVENHIGNCICFRHSYRWGGGRAVNEPLWRHTIALLNDLGIHYTLMPDGREVSGMNANPPDSLMQGPYYLGRRAHENDGAFYYWGSNNLVYEAPFRDIMSRSADLGGIIPHIRPARHEEQVWLFFDPLHAHNMKEAAEYFVHNLAVSKGESTRHSGPSTMFRYLFQAGYKCLLAEQMYGPEDVILSALRGASRAYGASDFGTHLALQWGSLPHDTQEHAERYFLSLALSYMHGATEINTEEGLWRMESHFADFDRYSHNCLIHQEAFHRFRHFLENNPRQGKLCAPIACLQGRYDGWLCFTRGNVWRQWGQEWVFGAPEESFDLLQQFYPRSVLSDVYRVPCPNAPQGWYSGSPYGVIDISPVETDWSQYRLLIFLGWHTYQPEDGAKMLAFVRQGGTLVLTRRHLCTATKRGTITYPEADSNLEALLGNGWRTDASGVLVRQIGKGEVYFFPTDAWPSEQSIRAEYEKTISFLAEKQAELEKKTQGWIKANDDVVFACYDLRDGSRKFYLLNIRWWDRKSSTVILQKGDESTPVAVPFGEIIVIHLS